MTISKDILITNKLGLHARAATKLAQLCQQFTADIQIELEENTADANSVMGLMLLAGSQGKTVKVHASGKDAEQAMFAINKLFTDNFDEEQ